MSDGTEYSDDEAAVDDVAALRVLEGLAARAAERGLLRGGELDEARWAVAQLRGLVEDWHGTERLRLIADAPAGSA